VSGPADSLRAHADAILAAVPDPSAGLPDDVFRLVGEIAPLVNVDLLIKDERSRTLLTWRSDALYGPGWHVPGSILRYKETLADRIRACALAELGATVTAEDAPLMILELIGAQRNRGHHISLLYRCRLTGALDPRRRAVSDPPQPGQWRWHHGAPPDLLPAQARYAALL